MNQGQDFKHVICDDRRVNLSPIIPYKGKKYFSEDEIKKSDKKNSEYLKKL